MKKLKSIYSTSMKFIKSKQNQFQDIRQNRKEVGRDKFLNVYYQYQDRDTNLPTIRVVFDQQGRPANPNRICGLFEVWLRAIVDHPPSVEEQQKQVALMEVQKENALHYESREREVSEDMARVKNGLMTRNEQIQKQHSDLGANSDKISDNFRTNANPNLDPKVYDQSEADLEFYNLKTDEKAHLKIWKGDASAKTELHDMNVNAFNDRVFNKKYSVEVNGKEQSQQTDELEDIFHHKRDRALFEQKMEQNVHEEWNYKKRNEWY